MEALSILTHSRLKEQVKVWFSSLQTWFVARRSWLSIFDGLSTQLNQEGLSMKSSYQSCAAFFDTMFSHKEIRRWLFDF
jgi:hypothetical protein